ncbi:hypothetical protein [Arundinibacter roseus]|nr:hypothetical protein [Arundinibacter roseus]
MKDLEKKVPIKNKKKTEMPHEVKLRKANELLTKVNVAGLKSS